MPEQLVDTAVRVLHNDGTYRFFPLFDKMGKAIDRDDNPFIAEPVSGRNRSSSKKKVKNENDEDDKIEIEKAKAADVEKSPEALLCLNYFSELRPLCRGARVYYYTDRLDAILHAIPATSYNGGFGWDFPEFDGWSASETLKAWADTITLYFDAPRQDLISEEDIVALAQDIAEGRRLKFKCCGKKDATTLVTEISTHFLSLYRTWITQDDLDALLKIQAAYPSKKLAYATLGRQREQDELHLLTGEPAPPMTLDFPTSECVKIAHGELGKWATGEKKDAIEEEDVSDDEELEDSVGKGKGKKLNKTKVDANGFSELYCIADSWWALILRLLIRGKG